MVRTGPRFRILDPIVEFKYRNDPGGKRSAWESARHIERPPKKKTPPPTPPTP